MNKRLLNIGIISFFLFSSILSALVFAETEDSSKRYNEYHWTWDDDYDPYEDPDDDYYYGDNGYDDDYGYENDGYDDDDYYDVDYGYGHEDDDDYIYEETCSDYDGDGYCDDGYSDYIAEYDCWDNDWDGYCDDWSDPYGSSSEIEYVETPVVVIVEYDECAAYYDSYSRVLYIPCLEFFYDNGYGGYYERYGAQLTRTYSGEFMVEDVWFVGNMSYSNDFSAFFDFRYAQPYKMVTPLLIYDGSPAWMDLFTYDFTYFWVGK